MILHNNQNFYEILDISPHSSSQEIREGYLKIKSAFNRDHVALYSLFSSEEREELLAKIELAFQTLSNYEAKQNYDQSIGLLNPTDLKNSSSAVPPPPSGSASVTSIDRVPPMETLVDSESLLIPPATDFTPIQAAQPPTTTPPSPTARPPSPPPARRLNPPLTEFREPLRSPPPHLASDLAQAIQIENDWHGFFIRRVREAYKISIEEMAAVTKVSKNYIMAIEDENYAKLPANVYIRGFITQIAKTLKLPHEKVANTYLSRISETKRNQK